MTIRFWDSSARMDDADKPTKVNRLVTLHESFLPYDNSLKRKITRSNHYCLLCKYPMIASKNRGKFMCRILCNDCIGKHCICNYCNKLFSNTLSRHKHVHTFHKSEIKRI